MLTSHKIQTDQNKYVPHYRYFENDKRYRVVQISKQFQWTKQKMFSVLSSGNMESNIFILNGNICIFFIRSFNIEFFSNFNDIICSYIHLKFFFRSLQK